MGGWLRAAVVATVSVVATVIIVSPGHAYECEVVDPRDGPPFEALHRGDAGVVGTVIAQRSGHVTVDVEIAVGQRLERWVTIDTLEEGADAAVTPEEGSRVGLVLYRREGGWYATACERVDPDLLVEAAEGPQAPQQGRASFVVAGQYGSAGLALLDDAGAVVAFGRGEGRGTAWSLEDCSQGDFLVERGGPTYWDGDDEPRIAVRELSTLETAWEVDVPELMGGDPRSGPNVVRGVACADDGQALHVLMGWFDPPEPDGRSAWRLLRVSPDGHEQLRSGQIEALQTVAGELVARLDGQHWAILDSDTGAARQLLDLPHDTRQLVASADGERLWVRTGPASFSDEPAEPHRLVTYHWPPRPADPHAETELPDSSGTAVSVAAHGDGVLAMIGTTATRRFHRFDADLNQTANWLAASMRTLDSAHGDVVGLDDDAIVRAPADADQFHQVASLAQLGGRTVQPLAEPIQVDVPWHPPAQPIYHADDLPRPSLFAALAGLAGSALHTWLLWLVLLLAIAAALYQRRPMAPQRKP